MNFKYKSSGPALRENGKSEKNSGLAYEKYKQSLNNLFDNIGKVSSGEAIVPTLGTQLRRPARGRMLASHAKSENSIYLEAVSRSCTQDEITNSFNALIEAGITIPNDEELLSKGLTHKSEEVALRLAEQLLQLLTTQPVKNPRLLRSRLENAASLHSGSLAEICDTIKAKFSSQGK